MAKFSNKRTLDYIWQKVAGWATAGNGVIESPFTSGPLAIDEPMTLYVQTWGDDAFEGTSLRPFATVQGAIEWLKPYDIHAAITIQIGPGTFPAFNVDGLTFGENGTLVIIGTTSVLYTGTITSITNEAAARYILTDSGASFTADQHKSRLISFVTPTSSTVGEQYRVVVTNSANTIEFAGAGSPASNGTQYQILQLDTQIVGDSGVASVTVGGALGAGLLSSVAYNVTQAAGYKIRLHLFDAVATGSLGKGLMSVGGDFATVGLRIIPNSSAPTVVSNPVLLVASRACLVATYIENQFATSSTAVVAGLGNNAAALLTSLRHCYISKRVTLNGIGMSVSGHLNVGGTCFEGCGTGVSINRASNILTSIGGWFKDCTTVAISTVNLTTVANVAVTGSTPTGIEVRDGGLAVLTSAVITATTGILAATGGRCKIASSGITLTCTTELSVDGSGSTLAAMRANNPKIFPTTANAYGSYVYE